MDTNHERLDLVNIEDEMKRAYIDYSMSVIIGRALPDARDGMKPGNRRILYAMNERGWNSSKAYVKCAKVVGEVIGNYHPHGDSAVYDTLVRMAQDFSMREMLIHGQGNFGSIDGDRAAAYRYTECKLMPSAEEMLADINKDTVDMRPNFDETLMEPTVLPARIPNLLVNGSTGIAVGMSTNIPPHNLQEVVDATIHLIDNPDCEVGELCRFVKGPDFPTGGIVHGLGAVRSLYETGRGALRMRGKAEITEDRSGKEVIVISEIPYGVNKASLITRAAQLVREKKIEGISDIRDESSKEGIRIVISLKRGQIPKVILNNLYKHTQLQSTFGGIMLAIDHGRPRVMNLKEALKCFIDHRFEVITRRARFDLEKAEARAHILEGFLKALDNIDEVVRIIRDSSDRSEAQQRLVARFEFSEPQVKAILDMRLYQLTGLEYDKLQAEYDEIQKLIAYLQDLLAHREKIFGVMKDDLAEIRDKYGSPRRTELLIDEGEVNIEDLIADEPCVVTITSKGYIKRISPDAYRQQRRGGKGVIAMATKDEDFVEHVFMASTHDYLLCFMQSGKMYWLKAYDIPEGTRQSRGRAIVNLLNLGEGESLATTIRVREFTDDQHLVMATAKGIVKKTNLSAYGNVRTTGLIGINIDEGDCLVGVKLTGGDDEIILSTRNGKSIRFDEQQLRDQGRATRGVKGIAITDDVVVAIDVVEADSTLLTITENGYGKRSSFEEFRKQSRGGKGIIAIKTSARNGKVVVAHSVRDDDGLMVVSEQGQMIRIGIDDCRVIGRNTQGVRLFNLAEGDRLVSASPIRTEVEEDDDEEGGEVAAEE
jgi:DNA gyrase subunit A